MTTETGKQNITELLHEELSYKIRGAILKVSQKYGKGFKESIYQNALAEEFVILGLKFEEQKRITIYSIETGRSLGIYTPDFIIEDLVIVEIKAADFNNLKFVEQELSYLKATKYELGFLVNFSSSPLFIKRLIYTNDRKPQVRVNP
jgi:GxxExxY protein